jgi:hypothetical protein
VLLLPYVTVPTDLSAGRDEPFTVSNNPRAGCGCFIARSCMARRTTSRSFGKTSRGVRRSCSSSSVRLRRVCDDAPEGRAADPDGDGRRDGRPCADAATGSARMAVTPSLILACGCTVRFTEKRRYVRRTGRQRVVRTQHVGPPRIRGWPRVRTCRRWSWIRMSADWPAVRRASNG